MKNLFIIIVFLFSNSLFAQAMNPKASELYERSISVQKECAMRIIRFNRLLKSGKLTYSQEKKNQAV